VSENNGQVNGQSEDQTNDQTIECRQVEICNERGLHARASAKFVGVAEKFKTEILVSKDGSEVVGTSIMGLMMLAAAKGDKVTLKGRGDHAKEALDALENLIGEKFGEE